MNTSTVAIVLPLVVFLAGCGQAASPAPTPGSHGKIVLDETGRDSAPTQLFQINPFKPWGIAYAYNCGHHPGDFSGVIFESLIAAELPYTTFSAHGTRGRGVRMETGSTSHIVGPDGKQAGNILNLHLKTTCSWHVRAVAGPKAAVQLDIPTRA